MSWCWAACCEMFGKTVDTSSAKTQADVVRFITGSTDNYFATGAETFEGAKYAANYKKSLTFKAIDFDTLVRKVKSKESVIAIGRNVKNPDIPGHTLLIHGTIFYDGDGGSQYEVYYCDPYNAKTFSCDYDAFCDGSYSGYSVYSIICTAG